jgi:ATP-binding cassette, subfamily B (MDR/TAP), member 1
LIADDIDDNCTTRCASGGKIVSVFFCVIMGSVGVGQVGIYLIPSSDKKQMVPPMNAVYTAKASAAKMLTICHRHPLIDGLSEEGEILVDGISGRIELKNISFAYPSRPDTLICRDYNLMVDAGQVLALCGMSGCGKSTIINLLLRFYDPQKGAVLIDGKNSNEMNIRWLRSKIGYVGQEPVLFSGTIAENIAYGLDHHYESHLTAEGIRQRVIEAAKLSNAHEFIENFPLGYETSVGSNGVALSGGQKQRIAIARALVKRPAILLLDEATSALDATSEQMVQQSIDSLQQSRAQTTIIIAHRLSTIRNADKIALIADGSVAELGTHDDLISLNGRYADLVRLQMTTTGTELFDSSLSKTTQSLVEESLPYERVMSTSSQTQVLAQGLLNATKSLSFSEEPLPTLSGADVNRMDEDLTPEEKKELNHRVWALILEHKGWLFLGLLGAAIFGAVFPLWGYILAKAQNMFFYSDTDKMRHQAITEAIYFSCLGLASLISCTLQYWGIAQVGERISARMRSDLFESYLRRGISYFDQTENSAGELCARLSNDSRLVHKAGGEALAKQLQAIFTLSVGCVIGFSASWRIAGVVIACFPANIIASAIQMQAVTGQQ